MKERIFTCSSCAHHWAVSYGTGRPENCPECGSKDIHREHTGEHACCHGRGEARRTDAGSGGRGRCGGGRPGNHKGREAATRRPNSM